MNNIFFSSSFDSYTNGKHVKNHLKQINYSNGKGNYTETQFGKMKKNMNINKKDIDNYLHNYGLMITDNIFNDAMSILQNNVLDNSLIVVPIYEGSQNKTTKKILSIENNKTNKKKKSHKCNLINQKYKLSGQNMKDSMKQIYKARSLKTHPDKCKTKECGEKFKELSLDYHDYFDLDNNC